MHSINNGSRNIYIYVFSLFSFNFFFFKLNFEFCGGLLEIYFKTQNLNNIYFNINGF